MERVEYEWVRQARNILLNQCAELDEAKFEGKFEFGFQSIKETLIHIAGCYHAWLGSFVLSETTSPLLTVEVIHTMKIEDIKRYFQQADRYVEMVFERLANKFDVSIEKPLCWKVNSGVVNKTPRQLLFHCITHESHHKGQIATMLRLLGHTPKNTDILGLSLEESTKS